MTQPLNNGEQGITPAKGIEETFRNSEEKFRSAFEYAAIRIVIANPDGRFTWANKSFITIVGYDVEEIMNICFQDITHPDDLEIDLNYVKQVFEGSLDYFNLEKRYIHKDGHSVWALLSASIVRDVNGDPLHFIAQVQDITGRKRAEEKEKTEKLIF